MILDTESNARADSNDDNLIPLINVVFLMLIFFMVAGHIEASDGIEVSPPASINEEDAPVEKLKIVVSNQGALFVDSKPFSNEELTRHLRQYIDSFSEGEIDKTLVELKADSQLTAEKLQDILMLIKSIGINRVSLVTQSEVQQEI